MHSARSVLGCDCFGTPGSVEPVWILVLPVALWTISNLMGAVTWGQITSIGASVALPAIYFEQKLGVQLLTRPCRNNFELNNNKDLGKQILVLRDLCNINGRGHIPQKYYCPKMGKLFIVVHFSKRFLKFLELLQRRHTSKY